MQKRNTKQKTAIFSSLRERRDHPSATVLYEALRLHLPDISKATVYRVLKEAAEEGEILKLHVGGEDRFDGDVRDHCHVICTACHKVVDAPLSMAELPEGERGWQIASRHVELYGLCPECAEKA